MRKSVLIILTFISITWISCNKKAENAATVEVIDGIEHIHNPGTPLYPDRKVSFEEELSIGGEDEDGNIQLYQPGSFVVDQSENIYIADRQDSIIKVFDKSGKSLRNIGSKGEGPGEFTSIGYLGFSPNGSLLIMDVRRRCSSIFTRDGAFQKSHQWKKSLSRLQLVTNSSYLTAIIKREEGEDFSEAILMLAEFDFDGNEIHSFGQFKMPEMKMMRQGDISFGLSVPHSPQSIFASDETSQR